jgi:hypothetical protein
MSSQPQSSIIHSTHAKRKRRANPMTSKKRMPTSSASDVQKSMDDGLAPVIGVK